MTIQETSTEILGLGEELNLRSKHSKKKEAGDECKRKSGLEQAPFKLAARKHALDL